MKDKDCTYAIVDIIEFANGGKLDVYRSVEDPLFLAADVAKLIDYSAGKTGQMIANLDDHEKVSINTRYFSSGNQKRGNPTKWFVTEDGLNTILLRSTKPIAKSLRIFVNRNLREMRRTMNLSPSEWFTFVDEEAYQEELAIEKWFDYIEGKFLPGYWCWVELGRPHLMIDPSGPPYYEGEEEEESLWLERNRTHISSGSSQ